MVDDAAVGRPELDAADPDVFLQVGRDRDVEIRHGAVGRHRESASVILKTRSGLPIDQPSANSRRLRQLGAVAFRRAGVDPRGDRVDLRLLQADVVGELADGRIGAPRRHLALDDLRLDRARPRPRVLVGHRATSAPSRRPDGTRRSSCRGSARRPWRRSAPRPTRPALPPSRPRRSPPEVSVASRPPNAGVQDTRSRLRASGPRDLGPRLKASGRLSRLVGPLALSPEP